MLVRALKNIMKLAMLVAWLDSLGFRGKFMLGRNQINVFSIVRPLEDEFILERILTNAMNVKNLSSWITSHQ